MSSDSAPPSAQSENYAKSAVDAIVGAYYPRQVSAVDAARSRAQSAYTVSSALATVLLGAGLLTALGERPLIVRGLGSIAIAAWLGAAGLYLRAVASPVTPPLRDVKDGAAAFVNAVLKRAEAERREIDARLNIANAGSLFALLVTATAIAVAVYWSPAQTVSGMIVLTRSGAEVIGEVCPQRPGTLTGAVAYESLNTDVLAIEAEEGVCDDVAVLLQVPRSSVAAVRVAT